MMTFAIPTDSAVLVHGPRQGAWTRDDWERLPDDGNRYEIIEGVLFVSKAPSNLHQHVILLLIEMLGVPAKRLGLGYPIFAGHGVFMPGCDPVMPDFGIVLNNHLDIIQDRRVQGVPDLIVEVLSPGNRSYDLSAKLQAYEAAGVPEYGVIDTAERSLMLYRLTGGSYGQPQVFEEAATAAFACLPGLPFRVGALFEGAPDETM
jgi:Uma2 family endonuclease